MAKAGDTGAHLDDFAGDLMTDDARKLNGQPSGLDMLDGQPRTASEDTRDGFTRPRNGIRNLAHLEWRVRPLKNQCFHDVVLSGKPGSCPEHEVSGLEKKCPVDTVGMKIGRRIAHQFLHPELLYVAVAAVDLEAPRGNLPRRL